MMLPLIIFCIYVFPNHAICMEMDKENGKNVLKSLISYLWFNSDEEFYNAKENSSDHDKYVSALPLNTQCACMVNILSNDLWFLVLNYLDSRDLASLSASSKWGYRCALLIPFWKYPKPQLRKKNMNTYEGKIEDFLFLHDIVQNWDDDSNLANYLKYLKISGCLLVMRDNEGNTPLHRACKLRKKDFAKVLLDAGASQSIVNEDDETPLLIVIKNKDRVLFDLLIDHESCLLKEHKIGYSLHTFNNDDDGTYYFLKKILILKPSDLIKSKNKTKKGKTLLWLAVEKDNEDLVATLLNNLSLISENEENNIPLFINEVPWSTKSWGDTPLHRACKKNNSRMVTMLLAAGADSELKNYKDRKAVYYVSKENSELRFKLLNSKSLKKAEKDFWS